MTLYPCVAGDRVPVEACGDRVHTRSMHCQNYRLRRWGSRDKKFVMPGED